MLTLGAAVGGGITGLVRDGRRVRPGLVDLRRLGPAHRLRAFAAAPAARDASAHGRQGARHHRHARGRALRRGARACSRLHDGEARLGRGRRHPRCCSRSSARRFSRSGGSGATGIGVLYAARGIGTAIGPFVVRRVAGETRRAMQTHIGLSFLIGGIFYIAFGLATNFVLALIVLAVAHAGGSILWVYSTVLLQTVGRRRVSRARLRRRAGRC